MWTNDFLALSCMTRVLGVSSIKLPTILASTLSAWMVDNTISLQGPPLESFTKPNSLTKNLMTSWFSRNPSLKKGIRIAIQDTGIAGQLYFCHVMSDESNFMSCRVK